MRNSCDVSPSGRDSRIENLVPAETITRRFLPPQQVVDGAMVEDLNAQLPVAAVPRVGQVVHSSLELGDVGWEAVGDHRLHRWQGDQGDDVGGRGRHGRRGSRTRVVDVGPRGGADRCEDLVRILQAARQAVSDGADGAVDEPKRLLAGFNIAIFVRFRCVALHPFHHGGIEHDDGVVELRSDPGVRGRCRRDRVDCMCQKDC